MVHDPFGIVGSVIAGTYEVEAVVAEGGFALVYRAHHTGFGAPVALKCLKLSKKLVSDRQSKFLAQFKAEASLLFRLSASIPTVVRPLHMDALFAKDGTFVPYMVLEWLEGQTLHAVIERRTAEKRPPLALKKIIRWLDPVAHALDRAHNFTNADGSAVSIVHSDIKPENIFVANVAGEQMVKILDFGIAKAQSVASQVASGTSGQHHFTPAYGAPEQWVPDKYGAVGPWTDVWGLALTLVECIAGRPIIIGDVGAMMGIALDPLARPTPRNNDIEVPDAVEAVFERALALDPQDRPDKVGQFWDDLTTALGMKDDRRRDARREVGAVLREERVGGAKKPEVLKRPVKLRMESSSAKAAPAPEPAFDDPFDLDEPLSPLGGFEPLGGSELLGAVPMSLEASLPSEPPDAPPAAPPRPSLEAAIPSVPEPVRFVQPAPAPPQITEAFELEAPRPPQRSSRPSASSFDDGLEASISIPPNAAGANRDMGGNIELQVGTSEVRFDLKNSELPPRAVTRIAAPRGLHQPLQAEPIREKRPISVVAVGIGLIVVAIVIGLADRALRTEDGTPSFSLGPVTLTVVAGILMLAGMGLVIYRLLPRDR